MFLKIGSNNYYETGLRITDLNIEENDNQYEVSYMLRSVREFNKVQTEYALLDENNNQIGFNTNELDKIKDGSFQINEKVMVDNNIKASKMRITIYEISESGTKRQMYDQTYDL